MTINLFTIVPVMMVAVFVLMVGVFAMLGIRVAKQNAQPLKSASAKVIAKRTHVSSSAFTTYFVTFELNIHDRMELRVPGAQFGLLVEGDQGTLQYQGDFLVGFVRQFQ